MTGMLLFSNSMNALIGVTTVKRQRKWVDSCDIRGSRVYPLRPHGLDVRAEGKEALVYGLSNEDDNYKLVRMTDW